MYKTGYQDGLRAMGGQMGQEGMGGEMSMHGGMAFTNTFLIPDISKAIIGEAHANWFYEKLAELAPNEQTRQTILRIQRDEAKHYRWFTMILSRLGGQPPQITAGKMPRTFQEGVRTAIQDELKRPRSTRTLPTELPIARLKCILCTPCITSSVMLHCFS
ncbi:ferritin-like domain-containing protein [Acinetobacter sp. CUI P1]|nr:ferritin-like domain-containing protein [Acinetobacter sp. CUI P1]